MAHPQNNDILDHPRAAQFPDLRISRRSSLIHPWKKTMLVKLDHFLNLRGENCKHVRNHWNHHLDLHRILLWFSLSLSCTHMLHVWKSCLHFFHQLIRKAKGPETSAPLKRNIKSSSNLHFWVQAVGVRWLCCFWPLSSSVNALCPSGEPLRHLVFFRSVEGFRSIN